MNYSVTILEMAVVALGLGLLLLDLWTPLGMKRQLGYAAAAALGFVLLFSFSSFIDAGVTITAFKGMYVQDGLALFFKRFFLLAAIINAMTEAAFRMMGPPWIAFLLAYDVVFTIACLYLFEIVLEAE